MNEKEQKAVDSLLDKICSADQSHNAYRYADALQVVMRAVLLRREAEVMGKEERK